MGVMREGAGLKCEVFESREERLFIHFGIGLALFFGGLHGYSDLDQRAFADAGAILGGAVPGLLALDNLGPERKCPALSGLGGMDSAAVPF